MTAIAFVSPFEDALLLEDRSRRWSCQHADAPEIIQPFWAALPVGGFISAAAEGVGTKRVKGRRWILAASGIRPRRGRHLKGRCLTFTEREEIALVALAECRCGASPASWVAHRRPCRVSCRATPIGAARTGRPARTRWRSREPVFPSRPSSGSTSGCARSSSRCWSAGTLPSRSRDAYACHSRLTRRCGCDGDDPPVALCVRRGAGVC
jgi:hypothetical protein